MKGPLFYSKILLFGEYGIIQDSKGLSIPYNFYNGALKKDDNSSEIAIKSNESLKKFVVYLEQLQAEQPELVTFNLTVLKQDVNSGMYFDSSIPQGYGVGSSGALVAAIYDKYANDKITVLENLTREKLVQLGSTHIFPSHSLQYAFCFPCSHLFLFLLFVQIALQILQVFSVLFLSFKKSLG